MARFIDCAANALDGNGDKLRETLAQLSGVARILANGSGNIVDIINNLQIFVTALRDSNAQIVQFQDRLATLTSVLDNSRSDLDAALTYLSDGVGESQRFIADTRDKTSEQIRLAAVTQNLADHKIDLENVLHVAPNAFANQYNIFGPDKAQRSAPSCSTTSPTRSSSSAPRSVRSRTPPHRKRPSSARNIWVRRCRLNFDYLPFPVNPSAEVHPDPARLIYTDPKLAPADGSDPARTRPTPGSFGLHRPGWRRSRTAGAGPTTRLALDAAPAPARPVPGVVPRSPGPPARPPPAREPAAMLVPAEGHDEWRFPARSAVATAALITAGCGFHGLNSLPLPGTRGRGPGAEVYHVEIANVGTLESNSPVMINDVVVGSVGKMSFANWHADVESVAAPRGHGSGQRHCPVGQTSLLGSMHLALDPPAGQPRAGHLQPGSTRVEPVLDLSVDRTDPVGVVSRGQRGRTGPNRRHHPQLQRRTVRPRTSDAICCPPQRLHRNPSRQRDNIIATITGWTAWPANRRAASRSVGRLAEIPPALDVLIRERPRFTMRWKNCGPSARQPLLVNDTQDDLVRNLTNLGPTLRRWPMSAPA